MQWYVIFLSLATAGALAWLALELVGRPVRKFFDLRRSVREHMLSLADVPTPQARETCVTSEQIRQYDRDLKKAREAQRVTGIGAAGIWSPTLRSTNCTSSPKVWECGANGFR